METLRTVLELAYFASGPIIVVLAAIGLWQIKVTKDNTRISARRDALALCAQQCDHYHRVITPLQNALFQAIRDKNITYLDKTEISIEVDRVKVKFNKPDDFFDQFISMVRNYCQF